MSITKPCLLIVDDDTDFRTLFRLHFQDLGYEILEATDGAAALEVFSERAGDIDLVLTDIRMPRMGGAQLVAELRHQRPLLPIIGITGEADLYGKIGELDGGAYYHLSKPIESWPIVERLIENAIRVQRLESSLSPEDD